MRTRYVLRRLGLRRRALIAKTPSRKLKGLSYYSHFFSTNEILKKAQKLRLFRSFQIGTYKSKRKQEGLPANGQRTRSNALLLEKNLIK